MPSLPAPMPAGAGCAEHSHKYTSLTSIRSTLPGACKAGLATCSEWPAHFKCKLLVAFRPLTLAPVLMGPRSLCSSLPSGFQLVNNNLMLGKGADKQNCICITIHADYENPFRLQKCENIAGMYTTESRQKQYHLSLENTLVT